MGGLTHSLNGLIDHVKITLPTALKGVKSTSGKKFFSKRSVKKRGAKKQGEKAS